MDQIHKQVSRARARLNLNCFLEFASWSVFASLCLAAAAYGVCVYTGGVTSAEMSFFVAGGLGAGVAAAAVAAYVQRRRSLEAAIEIDRRFSLKERVSSSLSLSEAERESEAGQALLADAIRRLERIEVAEEFQVRPRPLLALPLLAAGIFALTVFVPNPALQAKKAAEEKKALQAQIRKPAEELKKKIAKRKQTAIEKGLDDASKLLEKVSEDLDKITGDEVKKKDALVQMNDIAKEIAKRRAQLGGANDIKKKLEGLKNIKAGPADKMAKAMEQGDLNAAMDAMQDLKDKLSDGQLSEQEQQDLADQLQQMKDKMDQMRQEREQKMDELREQIKQRSQAGDLAGAEQLQQELDALSNQQSAMDQMQEMADKLGQAAENLQSSESDLAMESLDDVLDQLESMQEQLDELGELEDFMGDLDAAKQMMSGQYGSGDGSQMRGNGMGDGQGEGERPEEESDTGSFKSNVRGKLQKGAAVKTGSATGPNRKGLSREEVKEEIRMSISERADPVNQQQRLPKDQRDHLREYFQLFNENE